MRRLLAALALVLGAVLALPGVASAQDQGQVSVVHGIPGVDVDVWVNGAALLEGFAPGDVAGPLDLDPGTYAVEIYPAGTDPDGNDPILATDADLAAGDNVSLVAHLDADGNPALSAFVNDVSELGAGAARVTVRHTAAAPGVDVRAGGAVIFSGVENGGEGTIPELPASTVTADVVLAGTEDVVLGPADLTLEGGNLYTVYAIGSAADETLDLVVQAIPAAAAADDGGDDSGDDAGDDAADDGDSDEDPTSVPAGSGGLLDGDGGTPVLALTLIAMAAVGILGSGFVLARQRS